MEKGRPANGAPRNGPTVAAHGEPIDMTSQADECRTSISRADDGGHRWSPLATRMGYTRTAEQREAILAAIRSMRWIATPPPHASPRMHVGPVARTLAAAITRGAPLRCAAIASLHPGHTLIGLTDITGARHYLINLRHEAIHVLTEPDPQPGRMPGHQRYHDRSPATSAQSARTPARSARIRARSASTRETPSQADVTDRQRNSGTMP